MSAAKILAEQEGFSSEAARRKRLGQYFTGTALGRLLGALAGCKKANAIIDPMAGNGDILAACLELGANPLMLGAIDIDPLARNACAERLPPSVPILGSAFNPLTLRQLPLKQWDLVITNPPYVRYQSLSHGAGEGFKLPSALEVRNGLLAVLDELPGLDPEDKKIFKKLTRSYSGLADLAVPSWILCAALCAPDGHLALVVPESWLSRDFAAVVHYILLRWFRIEFIVEDAHAAWFSDAQVKTTLLIAKRIPRQESAFEWDDTEKFLKIRISSKAIGENGVVDNLYPGKENPEACFAQDAHKWLTTGETVKNELLEIQKVSMAHTAENLLRSCKKQKWLRGLEEKDKSGSSIDNYHLPASLSDWLASAGKVPSLVSLENLGVQVGQGLRTGANGFFYVTALNETTTGTMIESGPSLGNLTAVVCNSWALPAVRKQSELPDGYVVEASLLRGRVLALQNCALPEDIDSGGALAHTAYRVIPETLAKWIRSAEQVNFGTLDQPKKITELTAVAPNVRKGNLSRLSAPRYWYMLPDFAKRHKPDLLVPRINQDAPRAWLNKDKEAIVDANFTTICVNGSTGPDKWALLAMLNSSWCAAVLEASASVMGGGALKVEATHLRRLPIPSLKSKSWESLSKAGKALAEEKPTIKKATLEKIDSIIISALLEREPVEADLTILRAIATEGQTRRQNHSKKGK